MNGISDKLKAGNKTVNFRALKQERN